MYWFDSSICFWIYLDIFNLDLFLFSDLFPDLFLGLFFFRVSSIFIIFVCYLHLFVIFFPVACYFLDLYLWYCFSGILYYCFWDYFQICIGIFFICFWIHIWYCDSVLYFIPGFVSESALFLYSFGFGFASVTEFVFGYFPEMFQFIFRYFFRVYILGFI